MAFGKLSLYVFITLFGGITLMVFLICFFCHQKLQARTLNAAELMEPDDHRQRQRAARNQRRSDTHDLITAIVTPPPDYATVIKKDSLVPKPKEEEPAPPAYEIAMAELRSDGFV